MATVFSCHLANRGVVRLGGADRRAFLQGLVSNDVGKAGPGHAVYAALLTPQGKFLHDLFIVDAGDEFLIDCEAARAEDLLGRLAAYKLRAKITLANAQEEFEVWGMWNNKKILSAPQEDLGGKGIFFTDPRLPALGARAIAAKGTAPGTFARADFAAYDRHRLALGVADGSRDLLIEKSTLAEGNFDLLNGISWSKGCYTGQELTVRMRYRGLVKKRLFPVKIEGEAPAFGAAVKLGGEDSGAMRSACGEPGLALLDIEKAEASIRERTTLTCGESRLTASRPEWMDLKESG